jgi:ufm1-conjugating enzyme 1
MDSETKNTLQQLPLLTVKAGPRDGDLWVQRLKQEYKALIEVGDFNQCSSDHFSDPVSSMSK